MRFSFYALASAIIFLSVGILHGTRIIREWELVLGTYAVPMWVSWFVVLMAFLMAFSSIRQLR